MAASCGGCCRGNSSRVHVAVSTESLWMLVWQTLITTGGGELVVDVAVKVVRAKKKKKIRADAALVNFPAAAEGDR